MKFIAPVLVLSLATTVAHAQSFTVKKVKGKQAIVQMMNGTFSEGQNVTVGGGESAATSYSSGGAGSREKFIGLDGYFTSEKVGTNTQTTIVLNVDYGWNKQTMEYGFLAGTKIESGGGSNLTKLKAGGTFHYNFAENRPGVAGVMFAGIDAYFASTSGGAANSSGIGLYPNVGYKMFALGNATAITFDVGMNIVQSSGGAGGSSTDTQPGANVGLRAYF